MASASAKHPKKGHKTSVRDLVSIRSAKKLEDLVPSRRRSRVSKLYGYKA